MERNGNLTGKDSAKLHHLKFLMALFVVIIHTNNVSYYGATQGDWLYYIVTFFSVNLCRVAVPMFFFISGILFFKSVNCVKDVLPNIKKRVRTIVIPYFWWNIFGTAMFLVIFQLPGIRSVINSTDRLSIDNVLRGVFLYKYSGRNWYLVHLMAFVLLSPLFAIMLKRKISAVITLCALLTLNFSGFAYGEIRFFHLFYYYCGAFLVTWYPNILFGVRYKRITCFLALVPLLGVNCATLFISYWFLDKLAVLIMMLCLWVFVDLFSGFRVREFEKQAFFIYCIHGIPLETIEKLIGMLGKSHIMGLVDYIAAPTVCVLSIYILYRLLVRFVPRFYSFINGGRISKEIQDSKG